MMNVYLLIDFGSTYTKLTAVDIDNEEVIATAKDITTIEDDIMIGFNNAYAQLEKKLEGVEFKIVDKIACSSAAGGLKMVAIGLVEELTAEAAKRAALGAGARVIKTFSFELVKSEIEEIKNSEIDMILLAGGTNGGNKKCIIHNAKMIADSGLDIPVVVAGNKNANDEISEIFDKEGIYYSVTENVMPKLNELNVEKAREEIRKIFMKRIVEAKGLGSAEKYVSDILMPTPAAVLNAAKVLSEGSKEEDGLGDLLVVDIGGATTDIHSLSDGEPSKGGVTMKGLAEPFAKRTVEGDLGMRYSAESLLEAASPKKLRKFLNDSQREIDVEGECKRRFDNIRMVPSTEEEIKFDEAMAMAATEIAVTRHAGEVECTYTPMGAMYTQTGKDLMDIKYMIGTGGVLVHSKNPVRILESGKFNSDVPTSLKPRKPKFMVDKEYILSAMGLLAKKEPDIAVRIMKKYLIEAN